MVSAKKKKLVTKKLRIAADFLSRMARIDNVDAIILCLGCTGILWLL